MEKGPLKPKRLRNPYVFYVQEVGQQIKNKHPDDTVTFSKFSQTCAYKWKTLPPEEKERFEDMGKQDILRYKREMKNYKPPPPAGKKMELRSHRKARTKVSTQLPREKPSQYFDPPKKPISAFFFFTTEFYTKIKNENPQLSFGSRSKIIGEMWRNSSAEDRQPYEEAAEKSKERYTKEKIAYLERWNGFEGSDAAGSAAVAHDVQVELKEEKVDDYVDCIGTRPEDLLMPYNHVVLNSSF